MEKKERFIVNYSQTGHAQYPEDTWSESSEITDQEDLLLACKSWYKWSASSFNNYPFNGLFHFNNLSFKKQNIIVDDSGEIFYGRKEKCDKPIFFDDVVREFNEWENNLKIRLPRLREVREKRLKDVSDRNKYKELSLKYK